MLILQIILYHDAVAKNVWRSDNEGKGWKRIQGVPDGEAAQVIEHPFNSRVVRLRYFPSFGIFVLILLTMLALPLTTLSTTLSAIIAHLGIRAVQKQETLQNY